MKCVTNAWDSYEQELRHFLRGRVNDSQIAEDLLQDVFLKALAAGGKFCQLDNTRAWLYRVAKNQLIDFQRTQKNHVEIDHSHPQQIDEPAALVNLSKCLPTALKKMSKQDREVIELCDLEGLNQASYAELKKMTLAGAKSRIQRARKRLKVELNVACKIVFDEQGNVCCFDPDCR